MALLIVKISFTRLVSLKLSNNLDGLRVKITIAESMASMAITIMSSTKVKDFLDLELFIIIY